MENIIVDSRKIKKGDTFLALNGVVTDGHDFINKAIENGASKIIAERGNYPVETLIVENTRSYYAKYLKNRYGYIFDNLKIIGVTGTNGKTTSALLIHSALKKLGKKAAYIGTSGFFIEDKIKYLGNTTPDLPVLYESLERIYDESCEYLVMETSSEALLFNRLEEIEFDYALFTNLTPEHLNHHKTFENYALSKQKLFKKLKKSGKAIVNCDDENASTFLLDENQNITYGFSDCDYKITSFKDGINGSDISVKIDEELNFKTNLIGKYNAYNMMLVLITLICEGFKKEDILNVISNLEAPAGRMDKVSYNSNTIIVDYAHDPVGINNFMNSVYNLVSGKIYTVFGAAGERDKTKRPKMMQVVGKYSDFIILTNEDPRFEDEMGIINDLLRGYEKDNYKIILDRKTAIIEGMKLLKENDLLLILGKGPEDYVSIRGEKVFVNDKDEVLKYISSNQK